MTAGHTREPSGNDLPEGCIFRSEGVPLLKKARWREHLLQRRTVE